MKMTIGELEKLTGMNRTALRYYDSEGLLDPERGENGYRMYSEEDVLSLVQIKQLNALGVELSELPDVKNQVSCADIYRCLIGKEQQIENEIEEMYEKLSRLRLHVDAFRECAANETAVQEGRMIGAYRIYYRSPKADHPNTAAIFRRWMMEVPYTYSTIRIRQKALLLPASETCQADVGLGLLSGNFKRINETFQEPMEYTPPCKCIQGTIEARRLDSIPCAALQPFKEYIEQHSLIPIGDLYGWVVYSPVNHQRDTYRISLRVGIN
ncbi:MAG: MerR family transcriptional regulator [Clostridia bacterium]|nr:MerR family transcriptional regulator [Clostridia bacterium]